MLLRPLPNSNPGRLVLLWSSCAPETCSTSRCRFRTCATCASNYLFHGFAGITPPATPALADDRGEAEQARFRGHVDLLPTKPMVFILTPVVFLTIATDEIGVLGAAVRAGGAAVTARRKSDACAVWDGARFAEQPAAGPPIRRRPAGGAGAVLRDRPNTAACALGSDRFSRVCDKH